MRVAAVPAATSSPAANDWSNGTSVFEHNLTILLRYSGPISWASHQGHRIAIRAKLTIGYQPGRRESLSVLIDDCQMRERGSLNPAAPQTARPMKTSNMDPYPASLPPDARADRRPKPPVERRSAGYECAEHPGSQLLPDDGRRDGAPRLSVGKWAAATSSLRRWRSLRFDH
jgi:hypothetical protein